MSSADAKQKIKWLTQKLMRPLSCVCADRKAYHENVKTPSSAGLWCENRAMAFEIAQALGLPTGVLTRARRRPPTRPP